MHRAVFPAVPCFQLVAWSCLVLPGPACWPCLPLRRWFDLVIVLQAETAVLYDRLSKRWAGDGEGGSGPAIHFGARWHTGCRGWRGVCQHTVTEARRDKGQVSRLDDDQRGCAACTLASEGWVNGGIQDQGLYQWGLEVVRF